ncbi:hypothetical protein [Streptomyces sp. bgisy153]|uniref:hypothetical protein n=1 Tax=Streptomyces sp. bgisy153 TaxID=3413793 RepID=UPI003D751A16
MSAPRRLVDPTACRHCGINQREHARRWTTGVGWHTWTLPEQDLIKARMLARRAARTA